MSVRVVARRDLGVPIRALHIGRAFEGKGEVMLVGSVYGKVHMFSQEGKELGDPLDTKGGTVFHLQTLDMSPVAGVDVVAGDVDGGVTVFAARQILRHFALHEPLASLTRMHDPPCVLAGTTGGLLCAVTPHEVAWRTRLTDNAQVVSSSCGVHALAAVPPRVLVGGGAAQLLWTVRGDVVHAEELAGRVTCVASVPWPGVDALVACEDGQVYAVERTDVRVLSDVRVVVRHMFVGAHQRVWCAGDFAGVRVLCEGGESGGAVDTGDWVTALHGYADGTVVAQTGDTEVALLQCTSEHAMEVTV